MRIIDWSSDVCYSYLLVMGDDGHRGRRAVQRIADAAADAGHAVIRGHPHFGRGLARAEIAQLALNLLAGRLVGFRGDRGFEPRDRLAEQPIPARGDEVRAHRTRQLDPGPLGLVVVLPEHGSPKGRVFSPGRGEPRGTEFPSSSGQAWREN